MSRFPRYPLLFFDIFFRLLWISALLWIQTLPIKKILKIVSSNPSKNISADQPINHLLRYVNFLQQLFGFTCLKRSLLLFYFLQKWGIQAEFHLGVRYEAGQLSDGHAWLTLDGNIVYEKPQAALSTGNFFTYLTWPSSP